MLLLLCAILPLARADMIKAVWGLAQLKISYWFTRTSNHHVLFLVPLGYDSSNATPQFSSSSFTIFWGEHFLKKNRGLCAPTFLGLLVFALAKDLSSQRKKHAPASSCCGLNSGYQRETKQVTVFSLSKGICFKIPIGCPMYQHIYTVFSYTYLHTYDEVQFINKTV